MELVLLACSYTLRPQTLARALDRLVLKSRQHCKRGVIVCNNHRFDIPASNERWTFLAGSNQCLDFSAYFEAANYIKRYLATSDTIILLNDSLFTRHSARRTFQALINVLPIIASSLLPAMAGKADKYFSICFENPWSKLPIYVSSYCFAVNQSGFNLLLSLPEGQQFLNHNFTAPAVKGAAIQSTLQERLTEFIRQHIQHGSPYQWHQSQNHAHKPELLNKKAHCIYYEHKLSGVIGNRGLIVPINDSPANKLSLFIHDWVSRHRSIWSSALSSKLHDIVIVLQRGIRARPWLK